MQTPLDAIAPLQCICYAPDECEGCVCPDAERALRAYARTYPMPPMTPDQRAFCLAEIAHVEGYDCKDYEGENDQTLAKGVLHAWASYCQDIGLL